MTGCRPGTDEFGPGRRSYPCMANGDGTHRLPVKAAVRDAIGKQEGDEVTVRLTERIG